MIFLFIVFEEAASSLFCRAVLISKSVISPSALGTMSSPFERTSSRPTPPIEIKAFLILVPEVFSA